MAYLLPHLHSGWEVDQAIMTEEDRVVVIRFGRDQDPTCMVQDEVLMSIADKVKNFAVIYLVCTNESSIVGVLSSSFCEGHCTHTCSFPLFVSASTVLRHFYTT
jgi:hypothetical protein